MNKPIDNEAVHKKKWPIKSGLKARDITNIVTASIYKESRRIPQDPAGSRRIPQNPADEKGSMAHERQGEIECHHQRPIGARTKDKRQEETKEGRQKRVTTCAQQTLT